MPRQHCTNFLDIVQEESQANIEQKDKIVQNRDVLVLLCHVILQDQVNNGLSNTMGRQYFKVSPHTVKFEGPRHFVSEDKGFSLSCDLTRPCDHFFMVRSP